MSNVDAETLSDALNTVQELIDGKDTHSTEEYDKAVEKGLTNKQTHVVEQYAGSKIVEVDSSSVPTNAEKLAANKMIPITFVLDGVEFTVKTRYSISDNKAKREYSWSEDNYSFYYYTYDNKADEVKIFRK